MWLQLGALVGLMGAGLPIAFAMIGTSLIYVAVATDVPMTIIAQRMFAGLDDFTLMAIPLFVFAGYLMNETGITDRLITFAGILLRRVYGGLAQANILTSMLFGGVSGVAAADVAAVGTVMIPSMERDGYDRGQATGITLASSLMGPVIPPSIPFLIYGVQSERSIGALFLAGAIPGILIGLCLMVLTHVLLRRRGFVSAQSKLPPATLRQGLRAMGAALVALVMPVVIIGGIVGGVFTPTEAAGVAVGYALLTGVVFFRQLNPARFVTVCVRSAMTSTIVMMILVGSMALNWVLAHSRTPAIVADAFLGLTDSPAIFLLLVIVLLLLIGMPLDPVPGLMIMTPVLLPAALEFGVDPIHFGVVMVMTLVLGLITPPVGASLFVATAVSNLSIERLSIAVLPYLGILLLLTLVIAYVPAISLWLPSLFAG